MGNYLVVGRGTPSGCKRSVGSNPGLVLIIPTPLSSKMKTLIRSTSESLHSLLPLPNSLYQTYASISARSHETLNLTLRRVEELCRELEGVSFTAMSPKMESHERSVLVSARENTWSRKARRRLDKLRKEEVNVGGTESLVLNDAGKSALSLTIRCYFSGPGKSPKSTGGHTCLVMEATWTKGKDRELFETFWSHLSRKFTERVAATVS
jgi:hypothetical protein